MFSLNQTLLGVIIGSYEEELYKGVKMSQMFG